MNTETKITARPFVTEVTVADLLSPFNMKHHESFISFLLSRRGQFMSVMWARPLKLRAAYKNHDANKIVRAVVRAGIDYSNVAAVIEKRETGELPATPQPLPWGQWLRFPYVIEHKGELYVRLYPSNTPGHTVKTDWFLDGFPSSREILEPMCLASEFHDEQPDTFTVKLRSIKETLEVA